MAFIEKENQINAMQLMMNIVNNGVLKSKTKINSPPRRPRNKRQSNVLSDESLFVPHKDTFATYGSSKNVGARSGLLEITEKDKISCKINVNSGNEPKKVETSTNVGLII